MIFLLIGQVLKCLVRIMVFLSPPKWNMSEITWTEGPLTETTQAATSEQDPDLRLTLGCDRVCSGNLDNSSSALVFPV